MTDDVKLPHLAKQPSRQYSAVLEKLRLHSLRHLEGLFQAMFERLQAVIHEGARDLPETEQQSFLGVLKALKGQRSDLERRFGSVAEKAFRRLEPSDKDKSGAGLSSIDYSSLSLVKTEDMDVTVTMDSMVARARLSYAAPLGLLRRRYAHVLPGVEITERDMPLDPGCLVGAFSEALALLDIGVKEKIAIIQVFRQKVLDELGGLLEEANQLFITAGVLPDLKVAAAANEPKKPKPAAPEKTPPPSKPKKDTEEIFAFLQNMLGGAGGAGADGGGGPALPGMKYHGGQYVGGGGIGTVPAAAIGGSVAAVPLAPQHIAPTAVVQRVETPELVTKLSEIQQHQPKASLADDPSSPTVEEVRSSIRDNLRSDETTVEAIKRTDEDVINLVSMLFDLVLGDKDLPDVMKALIGRLQVPLLKVAILDKSFFNADSHPARRLLNSLARAGIGWSGRDPAGDVLYAKIENIVARVLSDFVDDLSLFEELLEEFTDFHAQQQKRVEAVDKRTRETEEGRARAELARAMVQQTLNRRLAGKQLPPVAIRLLQEGWRNVMYISCLKEGTESEAWKQTVKVVDAVIWSVMPQLGSDWQARLASLAPKLINSLKKGLASVNYDSLAAEKLLRELSEVQAGLQRGDSARTVSIVDAKTAQLKPEAGQVAVGEMERAGEHMAAVVLPEAEVTPVVQDSLPDNSEFVLLVGRLDVGCWVEFTADGKQGRHKLVARIRSVDKLIFANRRGVKVAEMSGMQLAVDLSLGRARLVEEVAFIDRALESMIGNLRDISSKTAATAGGVAG